MPQTILSTLLSSPSFTATNENTGASVWSKLGILDVEIDSSSANSDKPISNEQATSSNGSITGTFQSILAADVAAIKIIQPSRLRVTALCDDLSTLENIISTFTDDTVTISINTKSVITSYLVLGDVEIEQSNDMISAAKVVLTFEQAQPPQSAGFSPEQAADGSLYGITLTQPPTVVPLATLAKAVSSASFIPTVSVSGALIDSIGGPFILDFSRLS